MNTITKHPKVPYSIEDMEKRIATIEEQIEGNAFFCAEEAHRVMRSHILGLD